MRLVGKLIATVIIISLLGLTILLALLHTRHATPLISHLINTLTPYRVHATSVRYHILDPWHLQIDELTLQLPAADAQIPEPITVPRLELWLNPTRLLQPGWSFDTLLIDGLTLTGTPPLAAFPAMEANHLALTHFNWNSGPLSLTDSRLQLNHWQSDPAAPYAYQGDVQLAAASIRWQQQEFSNILIDGQRDDHQWTLHGFSFHWHGATLSGQAEYLAPPDVRPQWRIHQLSLADLTFQDQTLANHLTAQWQHYLSATRPQIELQRLDILNSSVELPGLTLNGANLSLRGWRLDDGYAPEEALWQQQEATLSFGADSLQWREILLDEPLAELHFRPQQIQLSALSTRLLGGYLTTDGTITPDFLALNQFTARNLQWDLPTDWASTLHQLAAPFADISVQELNIGYSALTAADPTWPFHLGGLNASGHDLHLKRRGHPGLWQGNLTASASSAGLNGIPVAESMLDMTAQAGQWQLNRLALSFEHGLLEAQGEVALHREGLPWQLILNGDSLPVAVLPRWLQLPVSFDGRLDVALDAQGLGQHPTGLAYSLEGELTANLRQLRLSRLTQDQLWRQWQQPSLILAAVPRPGPDATVSSLPSGAAQESETPRLEERPSQGRLSEALLAEKAPPEKRLPGASTGVLQATPLRLRADRGRIRINPFEIKGENWSATLSGQWDLARPGARQLELKAEQGCERLERRWQGDQQSVSLSSCAGNNI
ncbi:AsmA family protein [Photobacterium sp. TY1-4]|uniref:AsmA family protein n=1 Tax=Photobacterium sp. TY1-4 TaxID=2899122 RepID=UPI0021C0401A|nr:AsmA family protein [Photobacterium sp. TY1-4]UXI01189.1 AsmA family protein [Photobacterium sp. TY1-4]